MAKGKRLVDFLVPILSGFVGGASAVAIEVNTHFVSSLFLLNHQIQSQSHYTEKLIDMSANGLGATSSPVGNSFDISVNDGQPPSPTKDTILREIGKDEADHFYKLVLEVAPRINDFISEMNKSSGTVINANDSHAQTEWMTDWIAKYGKQFGNDIPYILDVARSLKMISDKDHFRYSSPNSPHAMESVRDLMAQLAHRVTSQTKTPSLEKPESVR